MICDLYVSDIQPVRFGQRLSILAKHHKYFAGPWKSCYWSLQDKVHKLLTENNSLEGGE